MISKGGTSWASVAADKIIALHPDASIYTTAAGISPSGVVHFGNFRDVATSHLVREALKEKGKKTRLIFSWDNFDRFRKVPIGVPESFVQYIGKPLSKIPDPFGELSSYAERFQKPFIEAMEQLGIDIEYRDQTALYESGVYDEMIFHALRNREKIAEILLSFMSEKAKGEKGLDPTHYRENYYPISVYSRFSGKDSTKILNYDGKSTITYLCAETGKEETVDLAKDHIAKLAWKIDWPMRWKHEQVRFEPGGHDHASPGGSYDVSSKVSKEIFDYNIKSEEKDRLSINSTIIADFIEINGLKGNAHQKRVPNWVFNITREQQLNFLAGYVDSDGYPTDKRKSNILIFRSPNKQLIEDLKCLVIYCELHPSNIHLIKSKHPFNKERIMFSYQTDISGNLRMIKSRYAPKSLRLNAKGYYHSFSSAENTTFRKHTNDYFGFAKIEDIKPIGVENVYDIEIEGYHNFIADGLIVHNSEIVYHNLKKDLEDKGVVFLDMDEAVQKYPELVKKYFMTTCVPINLHKFSALHAAVWSGGTFIYIPKNVKVDIPLQAYFRMNAKKGGQFEHTLIIVDEGAEVHYIEGCSAPQYTENSLHAGCVEVHVLKNARARYSSIENWSKNTYNLNTKRAMVHENAIMEWVNGNLGSRITMLYPCSMLIGKNSKSDYIGIAYAGKDQYQDTGCKVYHLAPNTSSTIISKGISKNGGVSSYRGLINIKKGCINSKSSVRCDGLMLDNESKALTCPTMEVN